MRVAARATCLRAPATAQLLHPPQRASGPCAERLARLRCFINHVAYRGLVNDTVVCESHHASIKRMVNGFTRAADFLSIVEGYSDGTMTERNSGNLRFHHDCQRPTTGARGLAPPLPLTCNAQVATPLSTHIWCLGLGLETTYQHDMEPRFQALSGREFKQGVDNYTVLDRKPFQEDLLGTMDTEIVMVLRLVEPKSTPSWLHGQISKRVPMQRVGSIMRMGTYAT